MRVKSRFLVGVCAWLLGAAAATSGSMIAVNQLAHGLLGPQTRQLTEANLSVNPDDASSRPVPSATAASDASPSSSAVKSARPGAKARSRASAAPSAAAPSAAATQQPRQSSSGKWLQSPDGSALAVCQAGGAYLQVWSADPGFRPDDVHRGPAAVASVTFENRTSELILRVSCVSGTPVGHVYQDH